VYVVSLALGIVGCEAVIGNVTDATGPSVEASDGGAVEAGPPVTSGGDAGDSGAEAGAACATLQVHAGSTIAGAEKRYQYSAVGAGAGTLLANWNAQPGPATYTISIGTSAGASDVLPATPVGTAQSYTASNLTLAGAWTGAKYFVHVTTASGCASTSKAVSIAEATSWDGTATTGVRNEAAPAGSAAPAGFVSNFPAGSALTSFYGAHYFETVNVLAGTTVSATPFGYVDNVPSGVAAGAPTVVTPKDGWLAIHANTITIAGTLDAAGRGYGGGGGAAQGTFSPGLGGVAGLSGNGGGASASGTPTGLGFGAGGGGRGVQNPGGSGGLLGGGGGGSVYGPTGATGGVAGGGAGAGGCVLTTAGPGGVAPYGGGGGGSGSGGGGNCNNGSIQNGAGGGGAGYGAGGGGGGGDDNLEAAGGGGGGGTGGSTGGAGLGAGVAGGAVGGSDATFGGGGGSGGYGVAGGNNDLTTDLSLLLGSGGGGGGAIPADGGGGAGAGGGALSLFAAGQLSLTATARILTVGAAGGGGYGLNATKGSGGGGGGGGGGILLAAGVLSMDPSAICDARGGAAGTAATAVNSHGTGGAGGGGGVSTTNGGSIKLLYGTRTPSATSLLGGRLYEPGPGTFAE
jgi:hypothetical protein